MKNIRPICLYTLSMIWDHRRQIHNREEHRKGLIDLYESQLRDTKDKPFMKIVLKEALRKLKKGNLPPKRIENWVVKLEKDWRNI